MMLSLTCEQCGETFKVKRKRGLVRRFCDSCRKAREKARKRGLKSLPQ